MPDLGVTGQPPTFLMTDVVGSTILWEEHPEVAGSVIERHDRLVATAVRDHGGHYVKGRGEGDSTLSVFDDAGRAVVAGVAVQRALLVEPWPPGCSIRVRAALYTGPAQERDGDYFGVALNRCARLRATAHGGQIVCAASTVAELDGGPGEVGLRDLGLHRLRDVSRAVRVFQIEADGLPVDFRPLRSLGVRHNLPAERTSFIGRHAELLHLARLLSIERVVTLVGPGGTGKTRLAVAAGRAALQGFSDGVFFADLATASGDEVVTRVVATSVGSDSLAAGGSSGRTGRELVEFLADRSLLLILDNCEHVVGAAAEFVDLIADRCDGVVVLATSRQALEVAGEHVVRLAPLGLDVAPGQLWSDAVTLFHDRLREWQQDSAGNEVSTITAICRRLDGVPLAVELAAARCADLDPSEVLEQLDDRLEVLSTTRPGRHQSLATVLDWSHDLLTDDERAVFRRLSVFPGPFSADDASVVCGPPFRVDLLWALERRSLLESAPGREHRYRMMETVRFYAALRLREAAEDEEVGDRHRDHYLAWLESVPEDLTFLDPSGAVCGEFHNLLAALRWSDERDRPDLVARLASSMNAIWLVDPSLGKRWLRRGRDGLSGLDREQRVRVLAVSAHVAILTIEGADGAFARAAVEESGGQPGLWSALAHAFVAFSECGRYFATKDPSHRSEADRLATLATGLATSPVAHQLTMCWIGQGLVLAEDLEAGIRALEEAAVPTIPAGDLSAVALAMLAIGHHLLGRDDEAGKLAEEARERASLLQGGGEWVTLYMALPSVLELGVSGNHWAAVHELRDRLEEAGDLRTPGIMTAVLNVLAALASLRDDRDTAGLLLAVVGRLVFTAGIRTPLDLALYSHYVRRESRLEWDGAVDTARADALTIDEAIAIGLGHANR